MKKFFSFATATTFWMLSAAAESVGDRAWSDPGFNLYAVVVGVKIDENSQLTSFRVAGVTEPKVDRKKLVEIELPDNYVNKVRAMMADGKRPPTMKDDEIVERFAYFYYSPQHPTTVIVDLSKSIDQQPKAEPVGAGQPATRPVDKPEGGDKPQPEAEGRAR
jgi:hypothetical protein